MHARAHASLSPRGIARELEQVAHQRNFRGQCFGRAVANQIERAQAPSSLASFYLLLSASDIAVRICQTEIEQTEQKEVLIPTNVDVHNIVRSRVKIRCVPRDTARNKDRNFCFTSDDAVRVNKVNANFTLYSSRPPIRFYR